jgi:hypothetical protein
LCTHRAAAGGDDTNGTAAEADKALGVGRKVSAQCVCYLAQRIVVGLFGRLRQANTDEKGTTYWICRLAARDSARVALCARTTARTVVTGEQTGYGTSASDEYNERDEESRRGEHICVMGGKFF